MINNEIIKFNVLSQEICKYLLLPTQSDEKFLDFLLSVLIGKKIKKVHKKPI